MEALKHSVLLLMPDGTTQFLYAIGDSPYEAAEDAKAQARVQAPRKVGQGLV